MATPALLSRLRPLIAYARDHRQLVVKLDLEDADALAEALGERPIARADLRADAARWELIIDAAISSWSVVSRPGLEGRV